MTCSSLNQNPMNLNEARVLATALIEKHGLTDWQFKFDTALSRFGCCKFRSKTITLSAKLTELNVEAKVTDTILHEIAHALVGVGHGHDSVWKRKALEIGCNGERCYNPQEVSTPDGKYSAVCPKCKHVHKKFRKKTRRSSCGFCSGGRFNPEYELKYTMNY
jgi:predicted SprT family Zn-dependent metalloprotease